MDNSETSPLQAEPEKAKCYTAQSDRRESHTQRNKTKLDNSETPPLQAEPEKAKCYTAQSDRRESHTQRKKNKLNKSETPPLQAEPEKAKCYSAQFRWKVNRARMITNIKNSHYRFLVSRLQEFQCGSSAILENMILKLRKEMIVLKQSTSSTPDGKYSWRTVLAHIKEKAPTIFAFASTLLVKTNKDRKGLKDPITRARLATMLSIALCHHNINTGNMLSMVTLHLWRCGTSIKALKYLSKLGVCHHLPKARRHLETVNAESKIKLRSWHDKLSLIAESRRAQSIYGANGITETHAATGREEARRDNRVAMETDESEAGPCTSTHPTPTETTESASTEDLPATRPKRRKKIKPEEAAVVEVPKKKDKPEPHESFSLCMDSIIMPPEVFKRAVHTGKKKRTPAPGPHAFNIQTPSRTTKGNTDLTQIPKFNQATTSVPLCQVYALRNRVAFNNPGRKGKGHPVLSLPMTTYLPSQADYDVLRIRMETIVQRILVEQVDYFKDMGKEVVQHIPHKYSKESEKETEFIYLGAADADMRTTDGVSKTLDHVKQYVPDGHRVPVYGSSLTLEVMEEVKASRSLEANEKDRLRELIPAPQDYEFRGLVNGDTLEELLKPTMSTDKGTLRHLKLQYYFKLKNDMGQCYKKVDDFLLFAGITHTVGFALEVMGMEQPSDDKPSKLDLPADNDKKKKKNNPNPSVVKKKQLEEVAREVVRRVWHQTPMSNVIDVMDAELDDQEEINYCKCGQDLDDEPMVRCSNDECERGRWFHLKCVKRQDVDPTEDWFCSAICLSSRGSSLCLCRRRLRKPAAPATLLCSNESCNRGTMFHEECVRCDKMEGKDGEWYCSADCLDMAEGASNRADTHLRYLEALTWRCLFKEAMRDAEREADGRFMLALWKIYMPEMWNRTHQKFMWTAHRFLAGVGGYLPWRLRDELLHNRTVNISGGAGKNISIGTFMKIQHHFFQTSAKRMVWNAWSRSLPVVIEGGEVAAGIGLELDRLVGKKKRNQKALPEMSHEKHRFAAYKSTVRKFHKDHSCYELYKVVPDRKLKSLPNYRYKAASINNPEELKETLYKYSESYDRDCSRAYPEGRV